MVSSSGGEYGILIMVLVFFGMFGVLITFMPATIFSNQGNTATGIYPSNFKVGSSSYKAGYINSTIDVGNYYEGPITWQTTNDTVIRLQWGILGNFDMYWFHIYAPNPSYWHHLYPYPLTKSYVVGLDQGNQTQLWLEDKDFHDRPKILLTLETNSSYIDLAHSWDAGHLRAIVGFPSNVTKEEVSYNVWQIVGQMMSFQTPNVNNPILLAIIGITIWAPIIAAIILVLDKLIPF